MPVVSAWRLLLFDRELVAVAVKGQDPDRTIDVGFEFLPEPQDVRVDRPRRGESLVAPYLVQKPLPCDHLAPMRDQEHQQVELLAREAQLLTGLEDLAGSRADADVAEGELLESRARARPTQHRAHP